MAIIGAHVSAAGGLYKCFANAAAIGADCLQIFGASPRQWAVRLPPAAEIKRYKEEEKKFGRGPVFLHASYLVNLGSVDLTLRKKSAANLAAHLQIAQQLGAAGLIFHIGSAGAGDRRVSARRVAEGMKEVLARASGRALLIMENGAGGGGKLGATPEEVGEVFRLVKSRRVKVCLDTQHAFAAGVMKNYGPAEIRELVRRCEAAFGWSEVVCLHVNDSKSQSGSFYDRHENIGEGRIGLSGFKNLAAGKDTKKLPWILEVPGFAGAGPDKVNVDILKRLFQE